MSIEGIIMKFLKNWSFPRKLIFYLHLVLSGDGWALFYPWTLDSLMLQRLWNACLWLCLILQSPPEPPEPVLWQSAASLRWQRATTARGAPASSPPTPGWWRSCGTPEWTPGSWWTASCPPSPCPPPTTSSSDTSDPGSWKRGDHNNNQRQWWNAIHEWCREPYNLKSIMLVYNLFQAVFNSWLFYKVWWLWRDHYDWNCQPVDYTYRSAHQYVLFVWYPWTTC